MAKSSGQFPSIDSPTYNGKPILFSREHTTLKLEISMAMYKQDLELCASPSHPYSFTEFDQFSTLAAPFSI